MKYKIQKESGVLDSKETRLQLDDGRVLCFLKEPFKEARMTQGQVIDIIIMGAFSILTAYSITVFEKQ